MLFSLGFMLATSILWSSVQGQVVPNISVPACSTQFDDGLSVNSLQQTPCQVAAYLGSVCVADGEFTILSILPGDNNYTLTSQDNCTCSTVYYSALSACASCQGATHLTWPEWSLNCSTVYPFYPNPVPPETAIPHWAFQNYSDTNDTFNITLAVMQGDLPESTALPSPTSVTGSGTSAATLPPTTATPSKDSGKTKAGAIAGGVVGALAVLSLLAVGALYYSRRTKPDRLFPEPMEEEPDKPDMYTTPTPFLLSQETNPSPSLRIYNPSDPSTFPPSRGTPQTRNTTPPPHYRSLSNTSGGYSGIAEV